MNRRLLLLAVYLVAGVMLSAYGASRVLAGPAASVVAKVQHPQRADLAGVGP